ncbi:ferrous iron transport protein B [[Clostridium] polysaccharolyticum]|uniref:Ferrous iron transport protein B n=1 Tax=[Clostridium] polysaccharolyticum TaxID=29364 RepID=A0A1I0D0Y4_9FIRM|nr:ferrous iron transport protein B [[Clostridium] polysaccharolyticum]SET25587.1 ferrous iron transport protein B [[Clostridium] polysaccharolyticum]
MGEELNVGFIGNPNCGKTTLFNAYTGAKLKVANWPGVTVEKKEGAMKYHDHRFKLVDLPGIYSLTSYTMEEKLSREYIIGNDVDVIVDVADASALERNLYLTLQLIEIGKPVVLALNMMDIVAERGMEIDLHRLPEMLGIPVIPVSARKRTGLDILMHTVAHHKSKTKQCALEHHHKHMSKSGTYRSDIRHEQHAIVYDDVIESKIDSLTILLSQKYKEIPNKRWVAIKLLEQDTEVMKRYPLDTQGIIDKSYETEITNQKYDFIEEIIEEVVVNKAEKVAATDKADRLLTNQYLGIPIFLAIMAAVFFVTFAVGDYLKGGFEWAIDTLSSGVTDGLLAIHASDVVISLVVDGIIAGVGGILTFLPNIFILFLALAFLEDSGYMARVAYVMDGIMGKLGLSGRAFIPMLLGFGCTVPAIMASRALEDKRDRFRTILVTPFMSCSARLPIYVLFSQMFFGKYAMLAAYSMYVIGLLVAIGIALMIKVFGKQKSINPLLIELPDFKTPNGRSIIIYVWDKVKDYLTKAGTTIFVASIIVWIFLNFNQDGLTTDISTSFGAALGVILVPVLKPAGLGMWQVGLSLLSGLSAKEVVVSSFCVLFHVANINSPQGIAKLQASLAAQGFTQVNAYAMMLFCLLYTPCIASLATIRRELQSRKWTAFVIAFQLIVAWTVTTLFYQIAVRL